MRANLNTTQNFQYLDLKPFADALNPKAIVLNKDTFVRFGIEGVTTQKITSKNALFHQAQKLADRVLDDKELELEQELLVATKGNTVVGFINFQESAIKNFGHVSVLGVAPNFEGQGIGWQLLQEAMTEFKKKGLKYMYLEATEDSHTYYEYKGLHHFSETETPLELTSTYTAKATGSQMYWCELKN